MVMMNVSPSIIDQDSEMEVVLCVCLCMVNYIKHIHTSSFFVHHMLGELLQQICFNLPR